MFGHEGNNGTSTAISLLTTDHQNMINLTPIHPTSILFTHHYIFSLADLYLMARPFQVGGIYSCVLFMILFRFRSFVGQENTT